MKYIKTFESFNKGIEVKISEIAGVNSNITLTKWLKDESDYVYEGDAICEIETDKVNIEITVENEGVLHIIKKQGELVNIGDTICILNQDVVKVISNKF